MRACEATPRHAESSSVVQERGKEARRRAVLALVLALTCGTACLSGKKPFDGRWRGVQLAAPSDHMVWQLTLLSLQGMGFPLAAGTDSGSGHVVTGWKTDLQPFRGEGRRWRAEVRMTPVESGLWRLEARVERERNENLVTPLDPTRADWQPDGSDERSAQILLMHVQARLNPSLEPAPARSEGDRTGPR